MRLYKTMKDSLRSHIYCGKTTFGSDDGLSGFPVPGRCLLVQGPEGFVEMTQVGKAAIMTDGFYGDVRQHQLSGGKVHP